MECAVALAVTKYSEPPEVLPGGQTDILVLGG
jgi:hypothetical protein